MASGRLSLSEQIAQLEETAPADYDPEDLQAQGAEVDDVMHVDASATREHYLDVGPSTLRKLFPSIADPKYASVRASRKQLFEDSDEGGPSGESDGGEVEQDGDESSGLDEEGSAAPGEPSEDEAPSKSEDDLDEKQEGTASVQDPQGQEKENDGAAEDFTSSLKKSREEEIRKGHAVKRQLGLWDALLDTRIRLQKSVVSANRLPPPSQMTEYLDDSRCQDAVSKFLNEASLLTDDLFKLQEMLLSANNVINPPPRKRQKLNFDNPSPKDYSEAFIAATEDATTLEVAVHPYFLQTLSKWSAKIQAVAPSVLLPSNRGSFLKGNQGLKSAVRLIDETLADNSKLLQRTQIMRAKRARIGVTLHQEDDEDGTGNVDAEIFDDTDFYQKVLRDIIDAGGNGNKNEDWMLLQKQKKAKKKVDTKASKGRKLRYEVHEKIQNFMVPVPVPDAWHEEQIDELFASLLGKGFENVAIDAEEPQVQQSIELSGFRVFG